ncbi:MAG TPA: hypothetical protein VN673_13265 [Clostridia bacterium]|nr:hypothetical protein [Clostridia bacterium]
MEVLISMCLLALVLFFAPACEVKNVEQGDFNKEFTRLTQEFGARVKATNGVPPLMASWVIKKDSNGFECVVRNVPYGSVEDAIFRILGDSGQRLQPGGDVLLRSCMFKAGDVGIALVAMDKMNEIQINCTRGITNRLGAFGPAQER